MSKIFRFSFVDLRAARHRRENGETAPETEVRCDMVMLNHEIALY